MTTSCFHAGRRARSYFQVDSRPLSPPIVNLIDGFRAFHAAFRRRLDRRRLEF
jgi:hypothetical protein